MAERLDSFDFDAAAQNRRRATKYDRLLDGAPWRAKLGQDGLPSKPNAAKAAIRQAARKHGLTVRFFAAGDGTLVVQASRNENAPAV